MVAAQITLNLLPGTPDFSFENAGHMLRWARGNSSKLRKLGVTSITGQKNGKDHVTIARTNGRWMIERFF